MRRSLAVPTLPDTEAKAVRHLLRQGFVTYLPRHLKRRRHTRHRECVLAPLFSCHLFVGFDPLVARWRLICSAVGVGHLTGRGDLLTPIPNSAVNELCARKNKKGFFPVEVTGYAVGDKARVAVHAFADMIGSSDSLSGHEWAVEQLELLGTLIRTLLPLGLVAAETL